MINFDFKDINLVPRYFDGFSRSSLDTSMSLGKHIFRYPAVPANMESVVNEDICFKLASNGFFYIMHRFNVDQLAFIKKFKNNGLITSISLGVKSEDYRLVDSMVELDLIPDYITIDIAHGHSKMMKDALTYYKSKLKDTFFICGNVATTEAYIDLIGWGADAIKVGVAPGYVCTTAMETGFGTRGIQASTIKKIASLNIQNHVPIIADGGISLPGEIAKALVLGAHMCMCGNLFTGFEESPGKLITDRQGNKFKEYYGSASAFNTGKTNRIEGTKKLVPYKDKSILEHYTSLIESLQASLSYAGIHNLHGIKDVKYELLK